MMIPLLSSLQNMTEIDQLPGALEYVTSLFSHLPQEVQIQYTGGILILSVVAKNLFLGFSMALGVWLSTRLTANIRCKAIDMLMDVEVKFFQETRVGYLTETILAKTMTVDNIFKWMIDIGVKSINFVVLTILIFIISWQLTLLTLLFSALIAFGISYYLKIVRSFGSKSARSNRKLNAALTENILGIRVIKYFSREKERGERMKLQINHNRRVRFRLKLVNSMIHLITEGVGILALGAIFFISLKSYQFNSKLLITQLLPFMYVLIRLIPVIREINQLRGFIAGNWPFLSIVEKLVDVSDKPILKDGTKNFTGLNKSIEFKNVDFAYNDDEKIVLKNATFRLPRGKTSAIVGQSGAGKSTIINLLMRMYDPQSGDVLIDNIPLKEFKRRDYREHVGIVSQDTFIFNDTVRNNIAFGAITPSTDDEIEQAAKNAGAHEFIKELPLGYNTILGDQGLILSGGQRQRISIARAILKDPEILILDEATSALDNVTEKQVYQAIESLSENRTVVVIAHRLSTIQHADQIIVLKDGEVVEIGKEDGLIARKGEYYRLAQSV